MKTFINIIKTFIISVLLGTGMLAIFGEMCDKTTTLGWWCSLIIIKFLGLFMIGLAVYLITHWKEFTPIQYEDDEDDEDMNMDDEDRSNEAMLNKWSDEEME